MITPNLRDFICKALHSIWKDAIAKVKADNPKTKGK